MVHALEPLLADGVIDEVLARLKSGKEADLWLVRHGEEVIAAKVYKAREARSFRNDAVYREGRQVRNTRTQRAMQRGSRFGQAAAEEEWKTKEADALHALHAAGVRVPRPVLFYEGVLLMELVVDAAGHPAPRLVDAHIAADQAAPLYADLRAQAVRMLAADLVHGDLSPYNVLLGAAGPVVIDFPQVVGAAHNTQAERFFRRDLENLRRFFVALDPALAAAAGDAHEIWRAYERRELSPDFVPTGRAPPPERRREGGPPPRPGAPKRPEHRGGPSRPPSHAQARGIPAPPRPAASGRAAPSPGHIPPRGPQPPSRPAPHVTRVPPRGAQQPRGAPHVTHVTHVPPRGPQGPPRVVSAPARPSPQAPPRAAHASPRATPPAAPAQRGTPAPHATPPAPGAQGSGSAPPAPSSPGARRRRRRRGARGR